MHLTGLSLQNFRNYSLQTFLFPKQTTVVVGKNTAGKTSIIEAVALLATGQSFRAEQVDEMIRFEEEIGRVKGKVISPQTEETELEALLTRGEVQGTRTQKMLYSVNTVRRRKKDFVSKFFTVVFRPEDMRLVEGSPARRRQFVDTVLCVTNPAYALSLKTYEDALKRRNRLLSQIQEGSMPRSVLSYWTNLIVKHGMIVQEERRQFFHFFANVEFPQPFEVEYLPSIVSESRMQEYADREIAAGHTLIGAHKDDFVVKLPINGVPQSIAIYGSRGQQRLAVLWLKVCELEYLSQQAQTQPLLLLDDILSELDDTHRQQVLSLLRNGQSIITTAEDTMVSEILQIVPNAEVVHL